MYVKLMIAQGLPETTQEDESPDLPQPISGWRIRRHHLRRSPPIGCLWHLRPILTSLQQPCEQPIGSRWHHWSTLTSPEVLPASGSMTHNHKLGI